MRNNGDDGYSQFGYEHEDISFFERAEMEQFDASYADTYSNEIVENPVLNEYRQDNYYYCTTGAKQITVSH